VTERQEPTRHRRPWIGWRILGGAPVPPIRRTLRAGDGIDEAAIGGDVGDPGGGADIARDFGDLDPAPLFERPAKGAPARPDSG
jgi:hypothetical protein